MQSSTRGLWIFIPLLLLFTHGLSWVGWDPTWGGRITKFVLILLILYIVMIRRFPWTPMVRYGMMLMFWCMLSIIGSWLVHDQALGYGFSTTFPYMAWLMLPLAYLFGLDERTMLRLCLVLGVWWVAVMAIQQFTYPNLLFAVRTDSEEGEVEVRNGIRRMMPYGETFGLLLLFYSFQRYVDEGRRIALIGLALGIVGVYLCSTRQVMAASAGCLLVGMYLKKKINVWAILGMLIIIGLIYYYADALFSSYVEQTESDLEGGDYIRFIAWEFYGLKYNDGNIIPFLIGNGEPDLNNSAYGAEIHMWEKTFGLYVSDVGLVGMYSRFGIFFVITILSFYWYIFRHRRHLDLYLQLYVLYMFVTNIMLWHFAGGTPTLFATGCVFFLIDHSLKRNQGEEEAIEEEEENGDEDVQEQIEESPPLLSHDLQHSDSGLQA